MTGVRNLFELSGRTAVVVGGAGGIGEAVARGLAAHGAAVVVADRDEAAAAATAERIHSDGGAAQTLTLDVLDGEAVQAAAERWAEAEILVTTPAINVRKPLLAMTDDEFDRVVELNLKGTFRLVRAFGAAMAERGRGSIVAFSSIRSQVVEPGQGVYAATKAGVLQLLRTLAAELGPRGVRVNAVAPGVVDTPLTQPIKDQPDWYQAYADKSILGRWATPEEMVGPVLLLASDAGSYITGSLLLVDGGWTAADGRFQPPL